MGNLLVTSLEGVDRHDTGAGHPERPGRLGAAVAGLRDAGLAEAVVPVAGRLATAAELERVHTPAYLASLQALAAAGGGQLDPDTVVGGGSWAAAVLAAGSGLAAVDALRRGEGDAALVLARPPGHHASAGAGSGFCLLNNVAIAAAALVEAGERVLIVDWDVHHGNGTQDLFWDDPGVLYASTHQWPAYPGTGRATDTGGPGAPGLTVDVPLPPGATGDVALAALDEVVAPAVDRFAPTWVLVSAGFDAHRRDPLASLAWSAGDFADLAARVAAYAPGPGRVVAFLEGGYDLDALRASVGAAASVLAGAPWRPEPATSGGPGRQDVAAAAGVHARLHREGGDPQPLRPRPPGRRSR